MHKWFYIVFSSHKQGQQSLICLGINTQDYECQIVGGFFDAVWGGNQAYEIEIGGEYPLEQYFHGYVRKVKIYDWPQLQESTKFRVRDDHTCHMFHYQQDKCEYCDHDFNFTCYSNCPEPDTWDYDCKACHPDCWTCSGSDSFQCFSCDDPDYQFHERGTVCPETCGDGILLGHFQCDDGDYLDNDGCSHDCKYEPGFECVPGTPMSPTICTEICGDG